MNNRRAPRTPAVAPMGRPGEPIAPGSHLAQALSLPRRRTLAMLARAQSRPALAPTPSDAEGPFYPRTLPPDRDGDLTRVAGRSGVAQGTPLYLAGTVRRTDGTPVPGTTVELWQCDALGVYHHVGATEPQDENFQGYGVVVAAADGRYAFTTIRPVAYPGRPPHLHFRLTPKSGQGLTTQLYIKGDGGPTSMSVGRDRLSLTLAPAQGREPGALTAEFDFVLR